MTTTAPPDTSHLFRMLEEMLEAQKSRLAPQVAEYLLFVTFTPPQVVRYQVLAQRVQRGELSAEERSELDQFLTLETFLMLIHLHAKDVLRPGTVTQ